MTAVIVFLAASAAATAQNAFPEGTGKADAGKIDAQKVRVVF